MWIYVYAGTFLSGLGFSLLLVPFMMRFATFFGILDYPSSRKIHSLPTPLLGGFAIFFAILLTVLFGLTGIRLNPEMLSLYSEGIARTTPSLLLFLLTSALVVAVGALDDLYCLSPWKKLLFQILCGIVTWSAGFKISLFLPLPFFSLLITTGWIVLCMNIFNLLDHMDGLAAGVALVSGLLFFLFSAFHGHLFIATLLACFLGSVAGFLWYNFPPASIFLGESGSSLLGYVLGTISIMATYYRYGESQSLLPIVIPLLIFALPLYDTVSVVAIRMKERRPLFQGDTSHLSHRLIRLGMSRKQAVLFSYLLVLSCGLGALSFVKLNGKEGFFVLFQTFFVLACVALLERVARNSKERE